MTDFANTEPRSAHKHHQRQPHRESDSVSNTAQSLSSVGSASSSLSSFQSYPASKPFLNTEWSRPQNAPVSKAFPESNRDLILGSLRKLQEKVTRLETASTNETVTENRGHFQTQTHPVYSDNVVHDVHDSNDYKKSHLHRVAFDVNDDTNSMSRETDSHFSSRVHESTPTERRVAELEKKLAEMRKLLNEDDLENMSWETKSKLYGSGERHIHINQPKSVIDVPFHEHDFDKSMMPSPSTSSASSVSQFESDSKGFVPSNDLKLTADDLIEQHLAHTRHSVIESSSSGLEHRQAKTTSKNTPGASQRAKTVRSKKRTQKAQQTPDFDGPRPNFRSKSVENLNSPLKSANHYRLNLGDIPFVVGKSTTPSHHLGSNIQNVISLLKQHHPKLCNSLHGSGCSGHHQHNCKNAATVAISSVRGNSQPRSAKRSAKTSDHAQYDETIHQHRTRRSEIEKPEKLKRSVSVPHMDDYIRENTTPKSSVFGRANDSTGSKVKSSKSTKKGSASKKLNKVQETSVNFRDKTPTPQYSSSSVLKSEPNGFDLNELLKILQEEYTKLVLQHYELTKRIASCYDDLTKNELELKAEFLDQKMRIKSRQIAKLKLFKLNRALKSTSKSFKDYSMLSPDENLECGHRKYEHDRSYAFDSISSPNLDYSSIDRSKSCHNHHHHHHHHQHQCSHDEFDPTDLHYVNHQITHQVHKDHLASHHHHNHHNHRTDEGSNLFSPKSHSYHHFLTSSSIMPNQNHNLKLFKDIKNLQSRIQNDQL